MANTPETIDTDKLVADPQAIDQLNQSVIKEFRENQGKVGGPMAGMPILLLTMTGAKTAERWCAHYATRAMAIAS
jgi:hypothetical protein